MGRKVSLLALLTGAIALAQPATTTVTDALRLANGGFCYGTITVSWTTFTSMDGFRIQGGSLPVPVSPSNGTFSVNLVPTNTVSTPNQGFYSIRYDLRPAICAAATSTWKVPSSGPVGLSGVETVSIPPPPQIPVNSLATPSTPGTYCLQFVGGIVAWSVSCANISIVGTARQIKVVTASGTATLSLPADLLLSGQSANGTDMLSGSRFTDTSPTGNFLNFKSFAGTPLWQVDVTGTLQAGIVPFARTSMTGANIVSLFSGCSGTLPLTADGSCHASGSGTVTSVALTVPTWLAVAGSPVTTAGTLAVSAAGAQTSHQVIGTCGAATSFGPCALVIGDLPTINFSNLAGSATCAQMPALTGDTASTAGTCATTTGKVNGVTYPASPSTNTVPVVTGANTVTYEAVPNAALANSAVTVTAGTSLSGGGSASLGASVTLNASANLRTRAIGGAFDGSGSALSSGATQTVYFTVPFACTISAWNITVDTGTITFDVWKVATGTAIPTSANSITAAALPAISSGTAVHSTTLTGWTTSVSANDIFGVNINTVSSATKASLILECDQST